MGRVYSATFSAVSVAAAQDLFEIVAASAKPVRILGAEIGQYSDAGDAQDELLSIQFIPGYTTSGSGGTSVTPAPIDPGDTAFGGTALIRHASPFNVRAGYVWMPVPDAITTNDTLWFEEIG